jgi:hypothetical protein
MPRLFTNDWLSLHNGSTAMAERWVTEGAARLYACCLSVYRPQEVVIGQREHLWFGTNWPRSSSHRQKIRRLPAAKLQHECLLQAEINSDRIKSVQS